MSDIVNKIGYAMSLRAPQKEALKYLDAISSKCDYKKDSKADVETIASENCESQKTIKVNDAFDFPSFCFDMATGIGKTRLMGASIYYLYKTKGYKNFFILAPGSTIYEKLRKETNPNHPKYIFKGLEAEMGRPRVYDGENYTNYSPRYEQVGFEKSSSIQIFIFNVGKIFNSKNDTQFNFHKFQEELGSSFAEVLAGFDDLVICMDESHRYYAPASMKAINFLKPVLGLEFTATPKSKSNVIYSYDVARGAAEGFLKTPVVLGRSNMAGYDDDDIEEMKIRDGLTLHENRKAILCQFCSDNGLEYVKPIVLVACKDTNHARKIRELIDNDSFENGKYHGKVIEIHSNMKGEESEENVRKLISIESNLNPIEIVLHVYKLKEGWDVNNLFTIIPLNAAKSDILAMQTIGRGLRLPFGRITGNENIDTLDIVAHDHYRELVAEIKENSMFKYRDLGDGEIEKTDSVDVQTAIDDDQIALFDLAVVDTGIKSFDQADDPAIQDKLYCSYMKMFGVATKTTNKIEDSSQMNLFDIDSNAEDPKAENSEYETSTSTTITPTFKLDPKKTKPLSKEDFVRKVKEYKRVAISVPKVSVQISSTVTFKSFSVKRTIADFDIESAKIERFDVVNQELLTSIDAQVLGVENAFETLACLLFDSISEISTEDVDLIVKLVNDYLSQIEGDDDEKRKIVRRYAPVIVNDIKSQMFEHIEEHTNIISTVEKDLIVFKKFNKSVKKDGRVRFDKPFNDKKNIKKYLFTGYKKSYYPENGFDSDTERVFSIILEEDPEVIRWIKPPINQLGLFWQAGQQYNPDFLVETADGKYMVETKSVKDSTTDEVISKAKEGIKWCKFATTADPDGKTWKYRLVTDNNVAEGNTCKYTLGTAKIIEE